MCKLREEEKKEKVIKKGAPEIVFEDENILVLDKPSGWVVNDAQTVKDRPTVQKWIEENGNFELSKDSVHRSGIVHRLDKETSGCLIVAKDRETFEALQKQFFDRSVEKTYKALVHGNIKGEKGVVKSPVGRLPWRRNRFGVLKDGREAETNFEVLKRFKKDGEFFTLLSLTPKTGRTHQIRIHLKSIGHPIVSDPFYAGRKTYRKDIKLLQRLFLHAERIVFEHPKTKKGINIQSPLPEELSSVLNLLESDSSIN